MPRYRLLIEYDGTPFVGWQIQGAGVSVQGTIATALAKLTGEIADVRGAGRTDSGVHATGQVAHVDLPRAYPEYVVREAINYHVRPMPVSVVDCAIVPDAFDARFSAIGRQHRSLQAMRQDIIALRAGQPVYRGKALFED